MANTLPVTSKVLLEAIDSLSQKSVVLRGIYKDYGSEFGGVKRIGNNLNIRKPSRFAVTTGADITSANKDVNEDYVALATNRYVIPMAFAADDMTFAIDDKRIRADVVANAADVLARKVDQAAFQQMLLYSANRVARTTITNAIGFDDVTSLKTRLSKQLAPMNRRILAMDADNDAGFIKDTKGLFQSAESIARQYEEGLVGRTNGFDIMSTESTPTLTLGTATSFGSVNSAMAEGATSVAVTGATSGGTVKAGQAFTIANVFAKDPQTHEKSNYLYTFVCAADVTLTAGAGTITFNTPVYTTNTNYTKANVHVGTSATSANLSTISSGSVTQLESGSGKAGKIMFAWHPLALSFASVDLPMPTAGVECAKESVDGITLRLMKFHNGTTDVGSYRLDLQCGFAVNYPELIATQAGIFA